VGLWAWLSERGLLPEQQAQQTVPASAPQYAAQPDSPFRYRLEYRDAEQLYGRGYLVLRNDDGRVVNWRTLPKSHGLESVNVVGEQYRLDALGDEAFAPGRPLRLVREPENEYDANAVAVYDAEGLLHVGYVPRTEAARIGKKLDDLRSFSIWELTDENGRRVQLRMLLLAADASIEPPPEIPPDAPADLDRDGQPLNLGFNRARRAERNVSEMLGLVKGVLADGVVTEAEAALLRDWAAQHPDASERWPVSVLKGRLDRIFADGRVDEREREDLAELLDSIVGGRAGIVAGADAATELPLDRPPPKIAWPDSVFVFTGKFAFGPRAECEREVGERGGVCERGVTRRTNYLVIGTFGSRDWVQTSYGRKIEKAVRYRDKRVPIAIVAEDHWADELP
jgi:hypothetical protein